MSFSSRICASPAYQPCLRCSLPPFFSVLVFILTLILLAIDFYYLKNIAGRRLVGLRWWNEVNVETGESHWVFESSSPETRTINATDKRFFWLTMYIVPALWVGLAILAIVRLIGVIWLVIVGKLRTMLPPQPRSCQLIRVHATAIALVLTITNSVAFSRANKFSEASTLANGAFGSGLAGRLAGNMVGRFFK